MRLGYGSGCACGRSCRGDDGVRSANVTTAACGSPRAPTIKDGWHGGTVARMDLATWFRMFDPFAPSKDIVGLKAGVVAGWLDAQDEWGMTALHLAVMIKWTEGVRALLEAGANTEVRYRRTGHTALFSAVQEKNEALAQTLLDGGADPDAQNYWGLTPRSWAATSGLGHVFENIVVRSSPTPEPVIQNAEHLADHHHPRFKIPKRKERESLVVGQAVDVHVLGPKKPAVKVRIRRVDGEGATVKYTAALDPPDQDTNMKPGTTEVTFGPMHVATVYLKRR